MRKDDVGLLNGNGCHSAAYHRHFEGYMERKIQNRKGTGETIERIYIAPFYVQELSKRKRLAVKIVYLCTFLVSAVVFLYISCMSLELNRIKLTGCFQAVLVFFHARFLLSMAARCSVPVRMTVGEYKNSFLALQNASAGAAAMNILLLLTALCTAVRDGIFQDAEMLAVAFGYFLSALIWTNVYRMEKSIPCRLEENPAGEQISGIIIGGDW